MKKAVKVSRVSSAQLKKLNNKGMYVMISSSKKELQRLESIAKTANKEQQTGLAKAARLKMLRLIKEKGQK